MNDDPSRPLAHFAVHPDGEVEALAPWQRVLADRWREACEQGPPDIRVEISVEQAVVDAFHEAMNAARVAITRTGAEFYTRRASRHRALVELFETIVSWSPDAARSTADDGCWADVWDEADEEYVACRTTKGVDGLGLCPEHAAKLKGLAGG